MTLFIEHGASDTLSLLRLNRAETRKTRTGFRGRTAGDHCSGGRVDRGISFGLHGVQHLGRGLYGFAAGPGDPHNANRSSFAFFQAHPHVGFLRDHGEQCE